MYFFCPPSSLSLSLLFGGGGGVGGGGRGDFLSLLLKLIIFAYGFYVSSVLTPYVIIYL